MPSPLQFGSVSVGDRPRVIGTVCDAAFLQKFAGGSAGPIQADIVELRLDHLGWSDPVLSQAAALQKQLPCLATIRSHREGGKFNQPDRERLEIYRRILPYFAGMDVELRSEIAAEAVQLCASQHKGCILSFHDFGKTPPLAELQGILEEAAGFAAVLKIVTTLQHENDLRVLEQLLASRNSQPLCVMGMGPLARPTRLEFPRKGSALTYGYLDAPAAPGQLSAAEIFDDLRRPAH